MKYRPDIDGLRAVAVLAVLGSHLKAPGMIGGFMGVDMFFVISGFLIGTLVEREVAEGRFSLLGFYERRFRRIFPALFAMLAVTTVLALVFALPTQLDSYGRSLAATALSISNVFFYTDVGYFQAQQASYPLLHTWSLGVEEQFYLLFPPLVLAVSRAPRGWRVPIYAAIAAVSFAVSAYGAIHWPTATFYLLHSRAWELLAGFALVVVPLPWLGQAWLRNLAGVAGLTAIAGATVFFWEAMPFPGLVALVPCGGAALVIAAGNHGTHWAGRLLSWRPAVLTGLISYSLYLWHWPLISFAEHGLDLSIARWDVRVGIVLLSFALAYASWRWVERPFRRQGRFTRRSIYAGAGAAAVAACAVAGVFVAGQGLPGRYPAEVVRMARYLEVDTRRLYRSGSCFITTGDSFADYRRDLCLTPRGGGRPAVLLLGNSHGAHLSHGLRARFPEIDVLQATASGCRPLVGTGPSRPPRCGQLRDYVFGEWLPPRRIDALLVSISWEQRDIAPLEKTIAWAKARGIPVIVSGPVPLYDQALPELLARGMMLDDPALAARHRRGRQARVDAAVGAAARRAGVTYVSPYRLLCGDRAGCRTTTPEGAPMQHDLSHLSAEGSLFVARLFDAPFRRLTAVGRR